MNPAAELGNVVLRIVRDGQARGRAHHAIAEDVMAAVAARPELLRGEASREETETMAKARQSVLVEIVTSNMHGRKRRPIIEAKLDLLIQVAKRDALIEAAQREGKAK